MAGWLLKEEDGTLRVGKIENRLDMLAMKVSMIVWTFYF